MPPIALILLLILGLAQALVLSRTASGILPKATAFVAGGGGSTATSPKRSSRDLEEMKAKGFSGALHIRR
jgi:hypothetical protein